jgi:hypothetical protein
LLDDNYGFTYREAKPAADRRHGQNRRNFEDDAVGTKIDEPFAISGREAQPTSSPCSVFREKDAALLTFDALLLTFCPK